MKNTPKTNLSQRSSIRSIKSNNRRSSIKSQLKSARKGKQIRNVVGWKKMKKSGQNGKVEKCQPSSLTGGSSKRSQSVKKGSKKGGEKSKMNFSTKQTSAQKASKFVANVLAQKKFDERQQQSGKSLATNLQSTKPENDFQSQISELTLPNNHLSSSSLASPQPMIVETISKIPNDLTITTTDAASHSRPSSSTTAKQSVSTELAPNL